MIRVDTIGNIDSIFVLPFASLPVATSAKWISHDRFLVLSSAFDQFSISFEWGITSLLYSNDVELLKDTFFIYQDTLTREVHQGIDFTYNNRIYLAGTKNHHLSFFQNEPAYYLLMCVDSNLNFKWIKSIEYNQEYLQLKKSSLPMMAECCLPALNTMQPQPTGRSVIFMSSNSIRWATM